MRKLNRWLPALIVAGIIFFLSSLHGSTVEELGLGKESYHLNGHFFLFFLFGFTLYRGTKSKVNSILIGIAYGILDEFHQSFVPGRGVQLRDIFVDSFGVLLSGLILWKFYHVLPKKLKNWLKK